MLVVCMCVCAVFVAPVGARHARVHRSIISLRHASLHLAWCLHSHTHTHTDRVGYPAFWLSVRSALGRFSFPCCPSCRSLSLSVSLSPCVSLSPAPCQAVTTIIDRSVCDYVVYLWALTCVQICLTIFELYAQCEQWVGARPSQWGSTETAARWAARICIN